MNMKNFSKAMLFGALTSLSMLAAAEEAWIQLEEVVVVGAVRSSDTVVVADVDVAGDESLQEMPVSYE